MITATITPEQYEIIVESVRYAKENGLYLDCDCDNALHALGAGEEGEGCLTLLQGKEPPKKVK